jgi:hypothetical protein
MNDRACPRDGVRPVGHVGSRPQGEVPRAGWACLESLEARLLLSGETAQQALELFSVSAALFAENQGQWADPSVRYVHHGNGVNMAMTDAGPGEPVAASLQGPVRRCPKILQMPCPGGRRLPGPEISIAFPELHGTQHLSLRCRHGVLISLTSLDRAVHWWRGWGPQALAPVRLVS